MSQYMEVVAYDFKADRRRTALLMFGLGTAQLGFAVWQDETLADAGSITFPLIAGSVLIWSAWAAIQMEERPLESDPPYKYQYILAWGRGMAVAWFCLMSFVTSLTSGGMVGVSKASPFGWQVAWVSAHLMGLIGLVFWAVVWQESMDKRFSPATDHSR